MSQAAMMVAMKAQSDQQMVQQTAMTMSEKAQTHQLKMVDTVIEGDRARNNLVEKVGNGFGADEGSKLKQQNDALSSSAAA